MSTITLQRTRQMVKHSGATGEISKMIVDGVAFWAVERRDGYIALDDGTYTVRMRGLFDVRLHQTLTSGGARLTVRHP
jgi:hypothetical protein